MKKVASNIDNNVLQRSPVRSGTDVFGGIETTHFARVFKTVCDQVSH